MRKPVLTIFYQYNPWDSSIGGIQTLITSIIKYAPNEFDVRLVGTSSDPALHLGKWQEAEFEGKEILFMPLIYIQNDDVRGLIPTTLKYTMALSGRRLASDFMHFYRLESTLATYHWQGDKTLFIQNDIREQISSSNDKNAFLWRRFPLAYFALERLLIGQFTQILSCNSDSAKHYQQSYPGIAERVTYFKNTVDNAIFYPLASEECEQRKLFLAKQLGLTEETRFILFAGRLHPQKDPLLLIRSIAALNEPNTHLLIAGDGELADEVRSEIDQLGLSGQVTMLGAVGHAELADLHRLSSACVLTSIYEGLPFVALEALACGTPIVTTRCGETPTLLTVESGVVCEERTPTAIASALRQILLHPENYPARACVQAAQPYGARTVIGDVYQEMLHRWEQRSLSYCP